MKPEADKSNFNFSQLCDDVSSTIEQLFCHCHLSVISYHFSGMHKKLSVLLEEAKIAAVGRALSGTLL